MYEPTITQQAAINQIIITCVNIGLGKPTQPINDPINKISAIQAVRLCSKSPVFIRAMLLNQTERASKLENRYGQILNSMPYFMHC